MKFYLNKKFTEIIINNDICLMPESWEYCKYSSLGGFKTGKDYKKYIGTKYNVFGSSEKAMNVKTNEYMHNGKSFIIGRKGTINKPYRIDEKFWCVDTAMYFDLKKGNRDFIFYSCKRTDWMKYNKGGVLPSLTQSFINNFEIIIPSKQEQDRIADVLSKQESIINKTKELINELDKRNTFMLDELLSGRLRIKDENGAITFYKNPEDNWQSVMMNGEEKRIPKDFKVESLKDTYKDLGKSKIKAGSAAQEGEYPFFNCSASQKLRSDEYIIDRDALYLSTGGRPAIHYYNGKASYSTDVWAIVFDKGNINNIFAYCFLNHNIHLIDSIFKGAGLKHLNKKDFQNINMIVPTMSEQSLIVNFIKKLNSEKEKYEQLLIEEQKKFDFLLEELMSGRLRIEE